MKITDYCTAGCDFCYQGSTASGKHADLSYIISVLQRLGKLNTFEVAIDDGEPLQYPYLEDVLKEARKNDIVPNISTKNYDLLKENIHLFEYVGGVALSIASLDDTKKAVDFIKGSEYKDKLSLHIPVGVIMKDEFISMLNHINTNLEDVIVTLLGYKEMGRGSKVEHYDYEDELYDILHEKYKYWSRY